MEKTPLFAGTYGQPYGTNPGFASTTGQAAMYAPPAPDNSCPSAPPTTYDNLPGYEGTLAGGGGGYLPPPAPAFPVPQPEPAPQPPNWTIPLISEDTARKRLEEYASSKCCYSKAPALDGVITAMEPHNTYRYRLETFAESRSTEWSQQPYTGQAVDAFAQPPPGPWDIPAKAPVFFTDETQVIRVPNTSSVKNCHSCVGMGRIPCKECAGAGNKVCWVCKGSGCRLGNERCHHCSGRGRENCICCTGHGFKECNICHGRRQLLVFINLKVTWTNHKEDYVVQQASGLKVDNLSKVSGKNMFKDSQYMVYPVMGFPEPGLVQSAERMVREHQAKYSQTSRILQQRQTIELIPITEVTYTWKGGSHGYLVYGNENLVQVDNYPATCCCSVM